MDELGVVDRPFNSFQLGECALFTKQITSEEVQQFSDLSGDHNGLHMDESYAATTLYQTRVAHGLLVAAPISRLAGHLLPGKRCLLLEVHSQFLHPVFPGDQLTYRGTIAQISPATRSLKVQVEVTNQKGAVVLKGGYTGQVLNDPSDERAS